MKNSCVCLALFLGMAAFGQPAEEGWIPLCNGRDLSGWESTPEHKHWSLQDGVIVGENDAEKKGSVLWTDREFDDFALKIDFRFAGVIDSGIFVKTTRYQVNLGNSSSLKRDMTCCIYAPKDGRGKYPAVAEDRKEILNRDDWNSVHIEAVGKRITIDLNGKRVVDYETVKMPEKGPIGLQIHRGHDMKIEFRNPQIRILGGETKL